jgi:multimeric flavodoxin WrbA
MNILALNSSPRSDGESMTGVMLAYLTEGMIAAGATVEIVNLREKSIKPCIGCFTCWTKTPGQCLHKDDMSRELFPKWLASDMVVYASPLYYHKMNAAMSAFIERTLPVVQPFFEHDGEKTFHPLRQKVPIAVWLSVCGFPEMSEFDALSQFIHRTRHRDLQLAAEIYRPAAAFMMHTEELKNDILDATRSAGRELVLSQKVSPETMARITQPVADAQTFALAGNTYWKTCIAEKVTPKEFREKKMVPRPDCLESFMLVLSRGLNAEAAGDRELTLQFTFTDRPADICHFAIKEGKVKAREGNASRPDIAIETPFELWMDIMTGKADGAQMFLEQKYTVAGDLALMQQLFQRPG